MPSPCPAPRRVVIAGGGVAALEAAVALHLLAAERVALTLVTPEDAYEERALQVLDPFTGPQARRARLADIAGDLGATLVAGAVGGVEPERRVLRLTDGGEVPYDELLLAVGARRRHALDHSVTFGGRRGVEDMHGVLQDLEEGWCASVAFVVPAGIAWSLPAYELALMTAARLEDVGLRDRVAVTVVTAEDEPLGVFGGETRDRVAALLVEAGVRQVTRAVATRRPHALSVRRRGGAPMEIAADRVVALPALLGPGLDGLPADAHGFLPVDAHGRVAGVPGVWAAGDATTHPVKQGGLAAQQAEAAARDIAAVAGAPVARRPFTPVLRAKLLTGREILELACRFEPGADDRPRIPIRDGSKVAGRFLGAYLRRRHEGPLAVPGLAAV